MTNERLAPNERKKPEFKDREAAWALVLEHAHLIHDRARWYYGQLMGRPVRYVGRPFHGTWQARGEFRGRQATDFIEETFAGVLEHMAMAFDRYDRDRSGIPTYVDRIVKYTLAHEIDYWKATSSRQPEDKGDIDMFLVTGGPDDKAARGHFLADSNAIDPDNDERLAVDPFGDPPEFGVEAADQLLAMLTVQEALTKNELFVLQRKVDGSSERAIAEDLGITRSTVQGTYRRALAKARKALEENDE